MNRLGFKDFFIKPIVFAIVTFFIIFFFFPSFSAEYLNVGFTTQSDSMSKVDSFSQNIKDKTGQTVDDMLGDLNTDEIKKLIN